MRERGLTLERIEERSELARMPLFSRCSPSELDGLVERLRSEEFDTGEDIVRANEPADRFYVMRQGRAAVLAQAGDGREYPVSELGPGSHFGEIGLLSEDARRTATVRCLDPVSVWSLDRAGFDHLLMGELQLADSLFASRDERRLADRARLLGERPECQPTRGTRR